MQKYNCKVCGGELYWDADVGALLCEYCDATYQVSDFEDLTIGAVENNKSSDVLLNTDGDIVVYQCNHCGAELVTSKETMATTCAYCGRAISITNKSVGNFRPEKIIPFSIDKERALTLYKEYITKSELAPREFIKDSVIEKMQGLYVPYWLYSMSVGANTSFDCERVSTRRSGDYNITTHNVYKVVVKTKGEFSFVPVDASTKLDNELMDSLDPYHIDKFVDYNPGYMAGFFAEQFDETKEGTFDRGREKIGSAVKNLAQSTVKNYTTVKLEDNKISARDEVVNYGMLPIWLLNIEYNNEKYTYAVNGQTGKVVGKIPISQKRLIKKSMKSVGIWYVVLLILSALSTHLGMNPLMMLLGLFL